MSLRRPLLAAALAAILATGCTTWRETEVELITNASSFEVLQGPFEWPFFTLGYGVTYILTYTERERLRE